MFVRYDCRESTDRKCPGRGLGELGLLETLCPFQLFYGDSVERLGAELARVHVRWVSAIWYVLSCQLFL
jgi:hypothetical protein